MSEVTVKQLAETVGASEERLLRQMKDAGLPHTAVDEAVSEEEKQQLLVHLKRSHGEDETAPKRITLKRKTLGTLKTSGQGRGRTVNVEVRKKRVYVKRGEDTARRLQAEGAEEARPLEPLQSEVEAQIHRNMSIL